MKTTATYQPSRSQGFTLVELLVYFALFSILLVVITNLFISSLEQRARDTFRSALQQESEYVLAKLRYDFVNADQITQPEVSGEVSSTLELVINGVTSSYSLDNQRLLVSRGGQLSYLTSNNLKIENVLFENQSGSSASQTMGVSFDMTALQPNDQAMGSRTVSTTLTRR